MVTILNKNVRLFHCWFQSLPEDHVEAGNNKKEEKPEPQSDVYLVIDHVDRKDTEPIKPAKYLGQKS